MRPVFLREMNGKYVTKLYSNDVNILREINGKYWSKIIMNIVSLPHFLQLLDFLLA